MEFVIPNESNYFSAVNYLAEDTNYCFINDDEEQTITLINNLEGAEAWHFRKSMHEQFGAKELD